MEGGREEGGYQFYLYQRGAGKPTLIHESDSGNIRWGWSGGKLYIKVRLNLVRYDPVSGTLTELSTFRDLEEAGFDIYSTPFKVSPDGRTLRSSLALGREDTEIEVYVIENPLAGRD
ncbi:MAG: hypothetical protein ACI80V_003325 [Rhodothermales bacterium]